MAKKSAAEKRRRRNKSRSRSWVLLIDTMPLDGDPHSEHVALVLAEHGGGILSTEICPRPVPADVAIRDIRRAIRRQGQPTAAITTCSDLSRALTDELPELPVRLVDEDEMLDELRASYAARVLPRSPEKIAAASVVAMSRYAPELIAAAESIVMLDPWDTFFEREFFTLEFEDFTPTHDTWMFIGNGGITMGVVGHVSHDAALQYLASNYSAGSPQLDHFTLSLIFYDDHELPNDLKRQFEERSWPFRHTFPQAMLVQGQTPQSGPVVDPQMATTLAVSCDVLQHFLNDHINELEETRAPLSIPGRSSMVGPVSITYHGDAFQLKR